MAAAGPEQPTAERSAEEIRAQQRTALLSVAAACFLVAVKLGAGLVTGSLGLLAEAAHSGTDLVAALLTFFAVRIAVRPADEEHHYGHGKAEHLAALAESTFLILVSGFLAYQAVARLASDTPHHVDTTWWAFAVLAIVIAVDASRAAISRRAARRHHSAALASNALHFASDLGGSLAVLIGLVFVALGEPRADSVAALIVGAIVLVAAARLAHQSIEVLMDRADADSEEAVRIALEELGDVEVRRLRSRHAAGRDFVDLVVAISADSGLAQAHTTADAIESAIRRQLPASDVVIHVEPRAVEGDLRDRASSRWGKHTPSSSASRRRSARRSRSCAACTPTSSRCPTPTGRRGPGATRRPRRARRSSRSSAATPAGRRRGSASATPTAAASRSSTSCCRPSSRCRARTA